MGIVIAVVIQVVVIAIALGVGYKLGKNSKQDSTSLPTT